MYFKLVIAACLLAFCAVVFSAYARLSDAGLGCTYWPTCYEENAIKQRQPPQAGTTTNQHDSWQWRVQNMVGLLLGILTIAICGHAWQKRKELRQSPLLPSLLLGLMIFLAAFGIWAFSYLPRAIIVPVHLAGGIITLMLLTSIALRLIAPASDINDSEVKRWRGFAQFGLLLVLAQIMLGGWVSSNFAALACTEFPLCKGVLLPPMDFSYNLDRFGMPLSVEKLTAIHWVHRVGALLTLIYVMWLSIGVIAINELRTAGKMMLGLIVLQCVIGISNVLFGLPLLGVVLHNAVAMMLVATLMLLNYKLRKQKPS